MAGVDDIRWSRDRRDEGKTVNPDHTGVDAYSGLRQE